MLHRYIQAAMGWPDNHLFAFRINGNEYRIPSRDLDIKVYDARRYRLDRLFSEPSGHLEYVYDFGDWWEHDVQIASAEEAQYRKQYPICVDGDGACPPEDCAEPGGYRDLLKALEDERNPRYREFSAWARSQHQERFSPQVATWSMRDVQRGYR